MDKGHYKTLSLFILILLITGCVGASDRASDTTEKIAGPTARGITVTEFSALREIYSTEEVNVMLVIKNIGESVAKNIEFDLYQLSGFKEKDIFGQGPLDLDPPDREFGIEGETHMVYWDLEAPDLTTDSMKYLKGRITYDYSTRATTNIYLVEASHYQEVGPRTFNVYSTSSSGPVVTRIIEHQPHRVRRDKNTKEVFLSFTMRNTGIGRVIKQDNTHLRNFEMDIIKGTEREINYPQDSGNKINCTEVDENGNITLFGTEQARSIRCNFNLTLDPDESAVSYIVEMNAEYTYQIDTPALGIRVRGDLPSRPGDTPSDDSGDSGTDGTSGDTSDSSGTGGGTGGWGGYLFPT